MTMTNLDFAAPTALPTGISRPQILICDDDPVFSSELIEALRRKGFAATALLSMSAVRAAMLLPSIIVLDLCMPTMDGIEVMRMLGDHPRRDHFEIVLISGESEGMLEIAANFGKAHGVQVLGKFQKPVAIRPLCELLETTGLFS
jgi:CheY-like chemotaxis protein